MRYNKTLNIVRGGLFTALGLLFMYFAVLIPQNSLFFAGAASAIIPICIIMSGIKYSLLVYTATSLLGIFLPGSKTAILSYIFFFGIYGILKYYIERLRKLPFEIILKLITFNVSLIASVSVYKLLFITLPPFKLSLWLLYAAAQVVFLVYDYALTLFINIIYKYLDKNA